jgi:hypothetical protein
MKTIFIVLAIIGAAIELLGSRGPSADVPPLANARSGKAIRMLEFKPLFENDRALATLARDGVYTVVEVYINTCGTCKALERDLAGFVESRDDVIIQRVHYPESGLRYDLRDADAFKRRIESYGMCGTPHIEIYRPNLTPLALDECGDKAAYDYLREWIAAQAMLKVNA